MARVTVEDCITKVRNRFELVVLAAQRTRQIEAGAPILIERDNDKNSVIALREIAGSKVDLDDLEDAVTQSYRRYVELDDAEKEMADMLSEEQELSEREIEIGGKGVEEVVVETEGQQVAEPLLEEEPTATSEEESTATSEEEPTPTPTAETAEEV